ncbi:MAG: DnaT-like ssDNA-binding protein [Limisphaerales bacterium]
MSTPVTLVVEDGTVVAGANTFITDAEFTQFCDDRGLTYAAADHERGHHILLAVDYLFSLEDKFQGERTSTDQVLPFPRDGVKLYGSYIGANTIPQVLKDGQCYLAQLAYKNDLQPTSDGKEVIEEKVGAMATKYNPSGTGKAKFDPAPAIAFLRKLYKWDAGMNIPILR